jgi:6-phosphogluconolactonase
MYRLLRIAAILGAIAIFFTGSAVTQVQAAGSDVVGHVYVNNNTAPINSISGFDRHSDGSLTPIPGSPFPIGGAGTGMVLGSQGALQMSGDGHYLLAVDAGSNEISVVRIQKDGRLQPVETSPVSSGGKMPVSIAVHDRWVYVANAGPGGSNYTGFKLNPGGHLHPLKNSTFALPDEAMPGDVLFSPDGSHLVGMRVGPDAGPSYIDSFTVGDHGRLTPAPGSPFMPQGIGPFGSEFRPTDSSQLFVSIAHDGPTKGSVSAYNVASNGAFTPVTGSPVANQQTGTCWVEISHDGRYLFAVNTGTPSISRYQIGANGSLTLLGNTPFQRPMELRPFDVRISPDDAYLYVVDAGAAAVSVFSVRGGDLTEMSSSPVSLPAGVTPFGIVVD